MILKGITLPKGKARGKDKFYQTKEWRNYSHNYLILNPLCKICDQQNRVTESQVVDHIQPIKQGGSRWASYNHQPLCKSCHAKKSALDNPNNHDKSKYNKQRD